MNKYLERVGKAFDLLAFLLTIYYGLKAVGYLFWTATIFYLVMAAKGTVNIDTNTWLGLALAGVQYYVLLLIFFIGYSLKYALKQRKVKA